MKKIGYLFSFLCITMTITAANTQQVHQKMHAFQKTANYFQKKADLYVRCFQKKCSPQEKAQALSDLQLAAKIVIPTGIALITVISGLTFFYKRQFATSSAENLKALFSNNIENAIHINDITWVTSMIDQGINPTQFTGSKHKPVPFYVISEGTPHMLQALIDKKPDIVNLRFRGFSLLASAINSGKIEHANILLSTPALNINIDQEGTFITPLTSPLYLAFLDAKKRNNDQLFKKLIGKYTTPHLKEYIVKINHATTHRSREEKNEIIQKIKTIAAQLGMNLDEAV